MKGDASVIERLNAILKNELAAINQYFLHARMLSDWGFKRLGEHTFQESIDEMKHADALVQRILFLGGLPNLQDIGRIGIGENVEEILRSDLRLENEAIPVLRDSVAHCENERDFISRELLNGILASEEEHVDWLETQLTLIDKLGPANYLQSQI